MRRGRKTGQEFAEWRSGRTFIPLPTCILEHPNRKRLSGIASKMLLDLLAQLRPKTGGVVNNGDMCRSRKILKDFGWNSDASIKRAIDELLHYGLIEQTRQGGLGFGPNLYAFTFYAINKCGEKLDISSTTSPSETWKEVRDDFRLPQKRSKELL